LLRGLLCGLLCGLLRGLLCGFALSLLLNHKETNHFYILSSKNRTYRNIVMKLRFGITFRLYKKKSNITKYMLSNTCDASQDMLENFERL